MEASLVYSRYFINLQLVRNSEKCALNRVVNNMICFNINYSQTKLDDGNLIYKFEPPIEMLTTFNFLKRHKPIPLKYSICQVINMELENEKLRIQKQKHDKSLNEILDNTSVCKRKLDESTSVKSEVTKDFFGRIVDKTINNKKFKNFNDRNKVSIKPKAKIWVKFHEGYSNAVRRPISIEELLK
ncbi:hypothetical protein PORY_001265 [Pneumocystis oryctolagi]|uniref:Uncharacterized protein n=1 Tax=Pneumocystis oryctolagi TaxID=42067 RepID=A0ACB7CDG2_9ASCO|nr:hypothetical protein PORY_001265 [Pneumocystis oryctolagi]